MIRTLTAGAVGVRTNGLDDALAKARAFGFEGLEFDVRSLPDDAWSKFKEAGVRPAVFGLPVEWRKDEATWREGLDALPALAEKAAALGCRRTATWVMSASDEREMAENVTFHVERFAPIAEVLGAHGISLGLEYIGPKTLRDRFTHPFVHTQAGMLDLARQIGPNVGLLLDAWHWYTSHGTVDDLRGLRPEQVVYVHVNDAPPEVEIDAQVDNVRRLPGATGVIDIATFLGALREIGYDGPVAAEPFDASLGDLPSDDDRLAATRDAMDKIGV